MARCLGGLACCALRPRVAKRRYRALQRTETSDNEHGGLVWARSARSAWVEADRAGRRGKAGLVVSPAQGPPFVYKRDRIGT